MKGLIQKSGYIKPGNGGGHYAEYIATREGVELMDAQYPSHEGSGYLEYMAERPRSHGLFSADGAADLEQTMEEINAHAGPVWTFIYSLKREDAARLGYENGESWRRLLLAHQTELATAMKIPPGSFRWCAAFHDEKHHPHIHMMAWSADPKQGYLTEKGIEQMRSQLSNDIFQDELLSIYQEKDLSYQQVRDAAMEAMGRLIQEMKSGLCDSPVIASQMETLAEMLSEVKGKKVYGYLKKPVRPRWMPSWMSWPDSRRWRSATSTGTGCGMSWSGITKTRQENTSHCLSNRNSKPSRIWSSGRQRNCTWGPSPSKIRP